MKKRFLLLLLLFASLDLQAQSVIFPQQQQAGAAQVAQSGAVFSLSNDLFTASFRESDGKLLFDGCAEMGLQAGTELFSITLGDGTEVQASEMTLGGVTTQTLSADATAAKGALRLPGKAIVATFTYGDLTLTWRAVLRDGSHYLRTELKVDASADVAFTSLTPMQYVVDNASSSSAPAVVGNTRGAVIASDKIFAGLETPMGIQTAGGDMSTAPFAYTAWNGSYFSWTPASDEIPSGITSLGLSATSVSGVKGYLYLPAGSQTVTFQYTSGSHRLDIAGVDVLDLNGNVVAYDYHKGYSGGAQNNRVYTLSVPSSGYYLVRYFRDKTEEVNGTISGSFNSNGTITWSTASSIVAPQLAYDGNTSANVVPDGSSGGGSYANPTLAVGGTRTDTWTTSSWSIASSVPARINEVGYYYPDVKTFSSGISFDQPGGTFNAQFMYASGNNGLSMVGVELVDDAGNVVASDYHKGFSGNAKTNHNYTFVVPAVGDYTLKYYCENATEANTSSGNINLSYDLVYTLHLAAPTETPIRGVWSRQTTLASGKSWNVAAVVGLIAPGQARRSFLAYSERERAVPWRAFPMYNSWFELNINRNNSEDYSGNFTEAQCAEVLDQWKTHLFDSYGVGIGSFVWDDGWDVYGTWEFNSHFPNGFQNLSDKAWAMNSQIGAWLGPVGGYGTSGTYRRNYWSSRGGMQLSNSEYYNVFLNRTSYMLNNYHFNYFKFDGISAQFSATGPDAGSTGQENAEAIIDIELKLREVKPDVFFNTSVGTWASPFWFQITDAVWRQENDWGTVGNQGNTRERWITYRDRLVYQNYVQNSPLCPINTLMTHGFILTNYGSGAKDMSQDYADVLREMRCAFACGSGMVEVYADYALMNSINNGALWGDLADCIKWQEAQADVLPDIHWVGGNPWDGTKANVYGWAAWNGTKAVLTLRNPAASAQSYTFTLREALDIPSYITSGTISFAKAFTQDDLTGLAVATDYDIDTPITVSLPASSVFVFNGTQDGAAAQPVDITWNVIDESGTICYTMTQSYTQGETVSDYPTDLTSALQARYVTLPALTPFAASASTHTVVYETDLPFNVSTDETSYWYELKIGDGYLVAQPATDGNAMLAKFPGAVNKMCWSFSGNPFDGFVLRPASATSSCLSLSSSAEGTQPALSATDYCWQVERVSASTFSLKAADATQYLNRHGAYETRVALWRSSGASDANSACLVQEADLADNLTSGYYRIRSHYMTNRYLSINRDATTMAMYSYDGTMASADMASTIFRLEEQPNGSFRVSQCGQYLQGTGATTSTAASALGSYFIAKGGGVYGFTVNSDNSNGRYYGHYAGYAFTNWELGESIGSQWEVTPFTSYDVLLHAVGDASYATVYLPFGIVLPDDQHLQATCIEANFTTRKAKILEMTSRAAPYGTPLLLVHDDAATSVTLLAADADCSADADAIAANDLRGLYAECATTGELVFAGPGGVPGFYKLKEDVNLAAYKAYLPLADEASSVRAVLIGSDTTPVSQIPCKVADGEPLYDMAGRRVLSPTRGHVYVQGGRKVWY